MEKKIELLVRERTFNIFSDTFYEELSVKINELNSNDNEGYVYVIKSHHTSYIKIGIAKDLRKRLCALNHSNGKIILIGYLFIEDYRAKEKELHLEFKSKNVFGEWFKLTDNDARDLISRDNFKIINKTFTPKLDLDETIYSKELLFNLTDLEKSAYAFFKENIEKDTFYNSRDIYKSYNNFNISQRKLTSIIIKYGKENSLSFIQKRTNAERFFKLSAEF